jgi:hypothetical protein
MIIKEGERTPLAMGLSVWITKKRISLSKRHLMSQLIIYMEEFSLLLK